MTTPKDLSKVSKEEFNDFLNSFDDVLCDCDGVLFTFVTAIDGSAEAIDNLKSRGKQVQYVTNNCTRTMEKFLSFISAFGIKVKEEDVIMPTFAIIDYLKSINFDKKIYMISFDAMRSEFKDAGFVLADGGPSEVEEEPAAIMKALKNDPDVGAVIVDLDINLNYIKLTKALLYLRNVDVMFITAGTDKLIPISESLTFMGPQFYQGALKEYSGKEPDRFGKPSKRLVEYANKKYRLNPNRTLFIGDAFSDMEFANDGGYEKMIVLTGVLKEDDIFRCDQEEIKPKYYLKRLGDLNDLLNKFKL